MELGRLVRGLDAATQARIDAAIAAAGADGRPNDASMLRSTIAALAGLGTVTGAQATAWQTALDRSLDSRGTGGGADPAAPQTASPPRSVALQADADHDALAIGDAGLPLVWPFLPQFFGGLGLADKAGFLDDAARHRAAAILFHLATGERDVDETRAVLPKVLTGIPLDALLRSRGPISDDEATAVERLLAALLGHAPMLGKLSVDGLRAAFLLRPGSLATHAGQWLLRVERQGHDVLLDRLPWSFGWVKLPWMAAPLQVDW
jgi:hypothetical protein